MKVFVALFVGVAMLLVSSEGSEEDNRQFIMYGPHGEIVDEDTPFFFLEDDYGNPQKVYLAKPNVSFAIPPLELRSRVRFHLFTRDTAHIPTGEQLFVGDNHVLTSSRFNPHLPVKVLIHGLGNTINSESIQNPMKAYMETGDYNVIGVDWGDNCQFPWYEWGIENTIPAGRYVAEFLMYLIKEFGINPQDIHIIGHSLGAHVSGIAGFSLAGIKVRRITGLDPAGPIYVRKEIPHEEMLDPTDGEFVDAIHTCGGDGFPMLGLRDPVATADFYPNGGQNDQPGCDSWFYHKRLTCSHSKAHKLWTESIHNPDMFHTYHCNSLEEATDQECKDPAYGVMGEHADPRMHGLYYLRTD